MNEQELLQENKDLKQQVKNLLAIQAELTNKIHELGFSKWIIDEGWTLHSSGDYYYRSKDFHQWPPDETADELELHKIYNGK